MRLRMRIVALTLVVCAEEWRRRNVERVFGEWSISDVVVHPQE